MREREARGGSMSSLTHFTRDENADLVAVKFRNVNDETAELTSFAAHLA